jgi:hypothetical protein
MEVKLYNRDLVTPVLDADLTFQHQRLQFSTKLNGGFGICRFTLKADLPKAWEYLTKKVYYRLVITDKTHTLWEGRLEDLSINPGEAGITAYGYYANLSDIPYSTAYNANASVAIKAILTANCAQISSDQTNIAATDISITSAADASYLDIYPKDLIEKLLSFSDSTMAKWYFAIWENRVPYLFKREAASVDWLVSLGDFARFELTHRAADLWNQTYAVYTAAGSLTRTADAENANSIAKYGVTRKKVISQLGSVSAAAAQGARDGWLQSHKDIWPRLTNMVLADKVYDSKGVAYPSSWVRAGDVLRVRDLVPASGDLDTVTLDALRTYYIVETNYDVDRAQLTITPDTESTSLTAQLAKKV